MRPLILRCLVEALGTALLLAVVVGSGIMGQALSGGNDALALLANSLATGAGLFVLITVLGPVSGAHFNPVVTLCSVLDREMQPLAAFAYIVSQAVGAVLGVMLAHAQFDQPLIQVANTPRDGLALALSEAVATLGLILVIGGSARFRPDQVPLCVALYITAAYWFTASTSFANPAVTFARSLTDTFAGIAPASVAAFVAAQLCGALLGWLLVRVLFHTDKGASIV
jgi:glycerol uptake facilitator-like aquaporin